MGSNSGEHPQDDESDDEDDQPKARRNAQDNSAGKKPTSRKSPAVAGRRADSGIVPAGTTVFFDLNFNIAAALCYFPLSGVASILWLVTEKNDNKYLKFHCVQSLVVTCALIAFNVISGTIMAILKIIPVIGEPIGFIIMLFQVVAGVLWMGLCFKTAYSLFSGKDGRLPVVADFSDQIVESYC